MPGTFEVPTVPVPFVMTHFWLMGAAGWVRTEAAYAPPVGSFVANVKLPFALTVTLSAPLSWSVTLSPAPSPTTVPPTVYVEEESTPPPPSRLPPSMGVQVTATVVTSAVAMVPVPEVTVHTSPTGWMKTVTA